MFVKKENYFHVNYFFSRFHEIKEHSRLIQMLDFSDCSRAGISILTSATDNLLWDWDLCEEENGTSSITFVQCQLKVEICSGYALDNFLSVPNFFYPSYFLILFSVSLFFLLDVTCGPSAWTNTHPGITGKYIKIVLFYFSVITWQRVQNQMDSK